MSETLCDLMDHSPSGPPVHGFLQATILEWLARPSTRKSFQPRMEPASLVFPALAGGFFITSTTWEAQAELYIVYYLNKYPLVVYIICIIFITCIDLRLYMMTIYYWDFCLFVCLGQENKSCYFTVKHIVVYFITVLYYSQYYLKKIKNHYLLQWSFYCPLWKEYVSLPYWHRPCHVTCFCSWNMSRSGYVKTQ